MSFDTRLLNGLNVLAAVAEAGNFVRAGEALGLTQSGVSRAMQRLEQQLGVGLLDRTPQSGDVNKRRKTVLSGSRSVTGRLGITGNCGAGSARWSCG
jgi:DNA-binding transcriptional LysR family regulator